MFRRTPFRIALALLGTGLMVACGGSPKIGPFKAGPNTLPFDGGTAALTVHGKLLLWQLGSPVDGAQILIEGHPIAVTNPDGTFTIDGVVPPYDLWVRSGPAANPTLTVYQALSRPELSLADFSGDVPSYPSATISGSVAALPAGTYNPRILNFFGDGLLPDGVGGSFSPSGTFSRSDVSWYGGQVASATLAALTQNSVTGTWYFGRRDNITVVDTATLSGQDIPMNAVPAKAVTLHLEPSALFSGTYSLAYGVAISPAVFSVVGSFTGSTASLNVPQVPGAEFFAFCSPPVPAGTTFAVAVSPLDSSNVTLTAPAPPTLSSPPDMAVDVNGSSLFSWDAAPASVSILSIQGPTGKPRFFAVTAGNNVQLVGSPELGISLPITGGYSWSVTRTPAFPDVDSAASSSTFSLPYVLWPGGSAQSSLRTFTFGS